MAKVGRGLGDSPELAVPVSSRKGRGAGETCFTGVGGAARLPWAQGTAPSPAGPATPRPSPLPPRGSCPPSRLTPFPLQKYIAQVLQDSEADGDGDGGPGSSGDEPPSTSSQDEELLMPPDGLTDTDFQSCEDSLIENEIHQ